MESSDFVKEAFPRLIQMAREQNMLTDSMAESLLSRNPRTLDEHEACVLELIDAIRKKDYYLLLDKIEKTESLLDQETDMQKRELYVNHLKRLCDELERLQPV